MSGCTGGTFFKLVHFSWLDYDDLDSFNINWSLVTALSPIPSEPWMSSTLSHDIVSQTRWWCYELFSSESGTTFPKPRWWDCEEVDIVVCIPRIFLIWLLMIIQLFRNLSHSVLCLQIRSIRIGNFSEQPEMFYNHICSFASGLWLKCNGTW